MASDKQTKQSSFNINLLKSKDYVYIKNLGKGSCGETALIRDPVIDEEFVCKKFKPEMDEEIASLFGNFVHEIKALHRVFHENIVRVYGYYLYPSSFTGYIVMEYINGEDIKDYIKANPGKINDIFLQTLKGFAHLESRKILHRDIRRANILVNSEGQVKIIDLGFSKSIRTIKDFNKSVSLNWWCQTPEEFKNSVYDFSTEVYFVGKLFEEIINDFEIVDFKYPRVLQEMCEFAPTLRVGSFQLCLSKATGTASAVQSFDQGEATIYRRFADAVTAYIDRIQSGFVFTSDVSKAIRDLEATYMNMMLEEHVPDFSKVINCFLEATYYYRKEETVDIVIVKQFLDLLKIFPAEKVQIVFGNLHNRINALPKYSAPSLLDDDVPF